MADNQDRQVDVSYHSKAWHAARIAQLSAERPNYDDWKEKRDAADRQAAREEEEREKAEEEYRRQLKKDRYVHTSDVSVGKIIHHLCSSVCRNGFAFGLRVPRGEGN